MNDRRSAPLRLSPTPWWRRFELSSARHQSIVRRWRQEQSRLAALVGAEEPLAPHFVRLAGSRRQPLAADELPQALAVASLACERLVGQSWPVVGTETTWDMIPRENQILCAALLTRGQIVELDTGEGKTLAAALAAACWALEGRVHVVTANDYLARRDHDWMAPLLHSLGLQVGLVHHGTPLGARRQAYQGDIVYVSVKEIGADFLRDSLTSDAGALLLPALEGAILDEVDFILVDEARVPLILAQEVAPEGNLCHRLNAQVAELVAEQDQHRRRLHQEVAQIAERQDWPASKKSFETTVRLAQLLLADSLDPELDRAFAAAAESGDSQQVRRVKKLIARFQKARRHDELTGDLLFTVDRRSSTVQLTETGIDRLVETFGDLFLPSPHETDHPAHQRQRLLALHHLLAAHVLYRRDRDYIVTDGQVVLVDPATGRPSFDRQLQHGLHRALEAKEGLYPALDHRAAAEITFPGLFQLYERFGGLSGTCLELTEEWKRAFHKKVSRVPPHRPPLRADYEDVLFRTADEKANALVAELQLARRFDQPVLVGTASVEQSEGLSERLQEEHIPHAVLNARHHEQEAQIIARAGQPGAVTVATAMAGRGTDIRPPAELPERIARAVAGWAWQELNLGVQPGIRLSVPSPEELDLLTQALDARQVAWRLGPSRRGEAILDLGPAPPPTALPVTLGLRVIGFELQGDPRLDRQLRGRTGRQGAPGSTRFYLSLDDETLLLYGDRARLAELRRAARPCVDPLSGQTVRCHRALVQTVKAAWATAAMVAERQRARLARFDAVDQAQRSHYDSERRALLEASEPTIASVADQTLDRAAQDLVREVTRDEEHLSVAGQAALDDLTQVWFERRGLLAHLENPRADEVVAELQKTLRRLYEVARQSHGAAMAPVERTVLLDALTEVWRGMAATRLELRAQAELLAYANRSPAEAYRSLVGQAYHDALAHAARWAASVLVTFPLPRETKTPRTGLPVEHPAILNLLAEGEPNQRSDYNQKTSPTVSDR